MERNEKRKRAHQRLVRFDEEENQFIKEKIKASPFDNFQNFARILLITGEIKNFDYSELHTLNQEVNRIGVNINQVVRLANSFDEISADDVRALQKEISELKTLVAEKLKTEIRRKK